MSQSNIPTHTSRIKIFQSVQSLGSGLHDLAIGICFTTM